jgi:hypothetical protein
MAQAFEILSLQVREKTWAPGKMPKPLLSLEALFENKWPDSVTTWKKAGEEDESVMPSLIGVSLKAGKLYALMLPWQDQDEKNAMKVVCAEFLQKRDVDHYVFTSEVWLRKGTPDGELIDHEDVKEDGLIQCGADRDGNMLSKTMIRRPKEGGGWDYMDDPHKEDIGQMSGDMMSFLVPRQDVSSFEMFEAHGDEEPDIEDIVMALKAKAQKGWPL